MPLAPFHFLAAIIPALGAPHLGGLDRLAIDACGTGGRLTPRVPARTFAQGLDHLGPCPITAPLGKVVIDSAFGQQIMRQHVPLAPAPVEIENRIEDFPHVDLPRAPPRRCCLAGGIMGSTIVHCSSVRSEGYAFRELPSCTIYAHSSPERICANYLPNLFLCQVIFPDSLLEQQNASKDDKEEQENKLRFYTTWKGYDMTDAGNAKRF